MSIFRRVRSAGEGPPHLRPRLGFLLACRPSWRQRAFATLPPDAGGLDPVFQLEASAGYHASTAPVRKNRSPQGIVAPAHPADHRRCTPPHNYGCIPFGVAKMPTGCHSERSEESPRAFGCFASLSMTRNDYPRHPKWDAPHNYTSSSSTLYVGSESRSGRRKTGSEPI